MEKYLIIIIIIIVIYQLCCNCIQTDVKETFTNSQSVTGIDDNNAINTLAALAKDLQSPAGVTIPGYLNATDLNVSNKLTVKDLQVDGVSNLTPKGGIIAWKPTIANIENKVLIPPPTWALCDGSNGTPDLRGRFILGSGHGAGLINRVLDTSGGFETVTLTEAQMPAHTHAYSYSDFNDGRVSGGNNANILYDGHVRWNNTNPVGGNQPHENMPPFYVLAYIMKL